MVATPAGWWNLSYSGPILSAQKKRTVLEYCQILLNIVVVVSYRPEKKVQYLNIDKTPTMGYNILCKIETL